MARPERNIVTVRQAQRPAAAPRQRDVARRHVRVLNRRLLLITLVLGAIAAPSAYFWNQYQVRRHAHHLSAVADRMVSEGKLAEAARQVISQIHLQGPSLERLRQLAGLLEKQAVNDFGQASRLVNVYAQILSEDGADDTTRRKLAELLLKQRLFDRVIDEAKILLERDPNDRVALRLLADAHMGLRKFDEAREHYAQLKTAVPTDVDAYVRLAACFLQSGIKKDIAQAGAILDEMVAKNPESGRAYYYRFSYRRIHDTAHAVADIERALELTPDDLEILLAGGANASAARQWPLAEERYRKAVSVAAKTGGFALASAYHGLGDVLAASGRADQAIETWRQALEKVGTNNLELNRRIVDVEIALAEALTASGRRAQAQERLRNNGVEARIALLRQILDRVKIERFRGEARELRDSIAVQTQYIDWLAARHRLIVRDPQSAIALLESAGRSEPGDNAVAFDAQQRLASAYTALGQPDLAVDAYRKALLLRPGSRPTRQALAELLFSLGRVDECLGEFSTLADGGELSGNARLAQARALLQRQAAVEPADRSWEGFQKTLQACREAGASPVELALLEAAGLAMQDPPQFERAAGVILAQQLQTMLQTVRGAETSAIQRLLVGGLLAARGKASQIPAVAQGSWVSRQRQSELARLWLGLGEVYLAWDKPALAERIVAQARRLLPRSNELLQGLIRLYVASGQADRALATIDAALDDPAANQSVLLRTKAAVLAQQGKPEATDVVVQLADANPNDVGLLQQACRELIRAGRLEEAERRIAALRKSEGDDGNTWRYLRALWLLARPEASPGDLEEAAKLYADVERRRPGWSQAHNLAAQIALRLGDANDAIEHLKRAIKLGDERPAVYSQLLALLTRRGDLQEAEAYLSRMRRSIAVDPNVIPLALQVSTGQKKFSEAIALARRGVAERPKEPMSHVWLGQVLALAVADKPDPKAEKEAEEAFRAAIGLEPQSAAPRVYLASYFVARGRMQEAEKVVEEIKSTLGDQERPQLVLGHCYTLLKKPEVARQYYLEALKQYPDDELVLRSASSFFLTNNMPEAKETFARLRSKVPDDPVIRRAYATHFYQQNNAAAWQQGLELLEGQNGAADLRLRAMLLTRLGGPDNLRSAIRLFEDLVARPSESTAQDRYLLAMLYEADGKTNRAIDQLLSVVYKDPVDPAHLAACIDLMLRAKRWHAEAARLLQKLEQVESGSFRAVAQRARWLNAGGQSADAVDSIERFLEKASDKPESAQLQAAAARVLASMNQHRDAEVLYRKIAAQLPEGYQQLVLYLASQKRGDEAARICLDRISSGDANQQLQALVLASGISAAAPVSADLEARIDRLLVEAAARHSSNQNLKTTLAERRLRLGQYAEAADLYRQVTTAAPQDVIAWNNLAIALSRIGKHEEARSAIDRAIELGGPKLELLDSRGLIQMAAGDLQGAINTFTKVSEHPRAAPYHHLHLAVAYARVNRQKESLEAFDKAKESGIETQTLSEDDRQMLAELSGLGQGPTS